MSVTEAAPVPGVEARLLAAFRRAAATVPAYRQLLDEHGVRVDGVTDVPTFARRCPVLSKGNTFDRFPLEDLSAGGTLRDIADVLTSSGHGGRFSFGVSTRAQAAAGAGRLDIAFDRAFGVKSRSTLAINCLPMGVVFGSECMTVATTSVREDMAVALVNTFARHYDQVMLAGDPLFLKRLTDHASDVGLEWRRHRVNVVIGEEIFGEHYRSYLAQQLGLDLDDPDGSYIMSSFGVGELGLHLCYETRATIALRRAAFRIPAFARELFGDGAGRGAPLPMLFTYDPLRTFIEVLDEDTSGYGRMTTSMLDEALTVPLLRYQTGDVIRLLDGASVRELAARYGVVLPDGVPGELLALRGREREALPNGSHVGVYKDALYADVELARQLTGAVRLIFEGTTCTMHVQLVPDCVPVDRFERRLAALLPSDARPERVIVWPYERFPFGMRLDYERKFAHYVPEGSGTLRQVSAHP